MYKRQELAWEGTAAMAKLFESEFSDKRVFVYSVPVYDGDTVIGALAASDHIEIFTDILSGNTVLGGGGYIHPVSYTHLDVYKRQWQRAYAPIKMP